MPEIIRTKETRYRDRDRDRDDYSSDDERSSYGRSRQSGGYKTVQRYRVTPGRSLAVEEIDDDRRSMRSERLEVGTRSNRLEVDRRERVEQIERPRSALEYREPERTRESRRTIVYERERDRERDLSPEPVSVRGWERERDVPRERERETDVRIQRRYRERDEEPLEVERFSRETEYYSPREAPVVIRERAPEPQKIIVETAPQQEKYEIVRREEIVNNREVAPPRRQQEDESYYYRRDVRETEPRRDEVARYERRDIRTRDNGNDDGYSDDEVVVRKERKVVRSGSHSPRHKLHLAEGALAGAGAAALLANHRDKSTGVSEHRGRKVAGGAALGALGAELVTRARSQYREKSRERERDRSRSSSRGHHPILKTGLAIAATALAAAAAGKYISKRNERKEEMARGRSRTRSVSRRRRYSSDDQEISKHTDTKHRAATIAKAGAGAAAVAGLVEHFRNKSQGRSKSRLRTGGVVAATGLAGAAVAGIYEARKAKHDAADDTARGRRQKSRSRSRARSIAYSDREIDPEMGLVEYGPGPVSTQAGYNYDPAAVAAERSRERHEGRSRSRARDIAAGAIAGVAATAGASEYQRRKERKEAERERRRYEEEAPAHHYYQESYDDDGYSPSPPRHSGGAFYPEQPAGIAPQGVPPPGFAQHPNFSATHVNDYAPNPAFDPAHPVYDQAHPPYDAAHGAPYNVADYPPPNPPPVDPYTYPAATATREARDAGNVSSTTPFAPLAQAPQPRDMYNNAEDEEAPSTHLVSTADSRSPSPSHNKSVTFAPLSPTSTRHLDKSHHRRNSDPSSDRPNTPSHYRRRHHTASRSPSPSESDDVEVLPDRFDPDGRPLDARGRPTAGRPKESEMVERIVHDFEDVIEGRQSWRSLLKGFFEEAGGGERGGRRR